MITQKSLFLRFSEQLNRLRNLSFRTSQRNINHTNDFSDDFDINFYDKEIEKLFIEAKSHGISLDEFEDGSFVLDHESRKMSKARSTNIF